MLYSQLKAEADSRIVGAASAKCRPVGAESAELGSRVVYNRAHCVWPALLPLSLEFHYDRSR